MDIFCDETFLPTKAPPNNEGYDLICIHPDPRKSSAQIRISVKSRYQTDSDRAFPLKDKSFGAFDYLIVAFLNNGYYYKKRPMSEGFSEPEFYTLPIELLKKHHQKSKSGLQRVRIWISTRMNEGLKSLLLT